MAKQLLDPGSQPKFVNELPVAPLLDASQPGTYEVHIGQAERWLGLTGADTDGDGIGDPIATTVWGYGPAGQPVTYPGPTFIAWQNQPVTVSWDNRLPRSGSLLPVDTGIHTPMMVHGATVVGQASHSEHEMTGHEMSGGGGSSGALSEGSVPIVTHLHGAHTTSGSDGLPEAWYTQDAAEYGADFHSAALTYDNDQRSATLWYHDHTVGMTRLNVMSGLAGFYLLRDGTEAGLVASGVLPGRAYEHVAALQDRAFTQDGQLYLPAYADDPLPGRTDTLGAILGPEGAAALSGGPPGSGFTGPAPGGAGSAPEFGTAAPAPDAMAVMSQAAPGGAGSAPGFGAAAPAPDAMAGLPASDSTGAFPGTAGGASGLDFPGSGVPGAGFTGAIPSTVSDILGPGFTGTYPSIVPEFFGDFVLVNGMTWPKFDADPGAYRFHLLNGSDSRFYVLRPDDPHVKLTLIGSDGGLLPRAITVADGDGVQEAGERLVLAPGDRADVVLDFSAPELRGRSVTLLNEGPAYQPFQGLDADGSLGGAVQAATPANSVGQVMRFDVGAEDASPNTATVTDGTVLDPAFEPMAEAEAARTRKLGLFQGTDDQGRVTLRLGVAEDAVDADGTPVAFGPLGYGDPVTETPALGTSEVWEIYNFTPAAHPIHLHLTQFQVLGRSRIAFMDADGDGVPDDVRGPGGPTVGGDPATDDVVELAPLPLGPMDVGWQDTDWVGPGEAIKIVALFDTPGEYVWHCHMLSHEDNDMMRPFIVTAAS